MGYTYRVRMTVHRRAATSVGVLSAGGWTPKLNDDYTGSSASVRRQSFGAAVSFLTRLTSASVLLPPPTRINRFRGFLRLAHQVVEGIRIVDALSQLTGYAERPRAQGLGHLAQLGHGIPHSPFNCFKSLLKLCHSLSRSLICPFKLADSASKAVNLACKSFFSRSIVSSRPERSKALSERLRSGFQPLFLDSPPNLLQSPLLLLHLLAEVLQDELLVLDGAVQLNEVALLVGYLVVQLHAVPLHAPNLLVCGLELGKADVLASPLLALLVGQGQPSPLRSTSLA